MDKTRAEIKALIGCPFRLRKVSFSDLARAEVYVITVPFTSVNNLDKVKWCKSEEVSLALKGITYKGLRII